MNDIVTKYKEYNPTAANSEAIIKILAGEFQVQDWEIMKELVMAGEYVSPSTVVTKKNKQTSSDILAEVVELLKLREYEAIDEVPETFKRLTKKALLMVKEIIEL